MIRLGSLRAQADLARYLCNRVWSYAGVAAGTIRVATASSIAPAMRVGEAHTLEPGESKTLGDVQEIAP